MESFSALILTGGKSSRMGRDKASLPFRNSSLLERAMDALSFCDDLLLSVAHPEDYPEAKIPHITDRYPGCGPMAGICRGLEEAKNDWLFVLACDMPFFQPDLIFSLMEKAEQHDPSLPFDAILPLSQNGRMEPLCALYHKRLQPVMEQCLVQGQYGLQKILKQHQILCVDMEQLNLESSAFANINTKADYEEIL